MAGLQDIRRRIRSVNSTQQVTKAMKMISAVKLRKSQDRLVALRPYADRMMDVVAQVVARFEDGAAAGLGPVAQAFVAPRPEARIRVVVVAGDKGFCGGFNTYLFKAAEDFLKGTPAEPVHLDVVGKRASDWARKNRLTTSSEHLHVAIPDLPQLAREIAQGAAEQYRSGEIDALYLVYTYFKSAMTQVPRVLRVFPSEAPRTAESARQVAHLLEPDPDTVLEALLPSFIETELLRCLLESAASEHGARMAAMDKASSNAEEMISKLTLNMNKIRQAAITNQIIEIVSGANS